MFLKEAKTATVLALRSVFNDAYPEADFRDINVSIEYPVAPQEVPTLWVDFEPSSSSLKTVGISHTEYQTTTAGEFRPVQRWEFQGYIAVTVVAYSSLVRDRLADEMISIFAFGRTSPKAAPLVAAIEHNDFIAMNFDWDQVTLSQVAITPGTPWGTDELLYEATVRIQCVGEFISDPETATLIPIRQVLVYPRRDDQTDTTTSDGWV